MIYLMLPGADRTICMIWQTFPGLRLYYLYTDPAQHVVTTDTR